MSIEQNMIRAGIVSSANPSAGTVRVTFPDRDDLVSDDLPVLTPGGWGRGNSVPLPGESVLCAFLGNGLQVGICLGSYYTDDEKPPGTDEQRGVWFEDGSQVYYDRSIRKLVVKAAGGVKIDGDLEVTGSIKRAGEVL
ncbi:phage baseplate assembly protein V [Paenibacillus faecis]|uniref:Phage baseplate assembly protein V n=1 Tax=Paenibacillus faecis TaxID=862114 RepID=A0A5D0CNX9_9BACL|nr:phage baseplate assembly protein V [Paenibacillus faecis]TYA10934.1 phage baseplate assembly protein V [Paenibacillus faecis]